VARLSKEEIRLEQEARFPESFQGAEPWLALADKALTLEGVREFSTSEWSAQGYTPPSIGLGIVAHDFHAIRGEYEAIRLEAKFITSEGLAQLRERQFELRDELRQQRTINEAKKIQQALWIIAQAMRDPHRRQFFSRAIRTLDLAVRIVRT